MRLRRESMAPYEWDLRRQPSPYRPAATFTEGLIIGAAIIGTMWLWWAV